MKFKTEEKLLEYTKEIIGKIVINTEIYSVFKEINS